MMIGEDVYGNKFDDIGLTCLLKTERLIYFCKRHSIVQQLFKSEVSNLVYLESSVQL